MGEMRVLNRKGDIVIEWDAQTPKSVAEAKKQWKQLEKDGYQFFEALPGEKGELLKKFDPELGRVLVVPGVKTKTDRKRGSRPKAMAGGPNERAVVPSGRRR